MNSSGVMCKYCQSENVRKFGKYKGTQLYYCNSCKRKFIPNDHLFHMRTPASQVSSAISMYYEGMSLRAICRHVEQEKGSTTTNKAVYDWVNKYTGEAIKAVSDYHPQVGDTWVADETVLEIDGQNVWFWDIIDRDTRFLLASRVSFTRTTADAKALFDKATKRAGKTPKVVVTDKLAAYLDGIELAYGADAEHHQGGPFAPEIENNTELIERFHSTLKTRTKVMRGLKDVDSAIQFTDGWLVHYNFLRPHEALDGKTPAEAAKIDYPCKNWAYITRMTKPQVNLLVTPEVRSVLEEKPVFVRQPVHVRYDTERKRKLRAAHRNKTKRDKSASTGVSRAR